MEPNTVKTRFNWANLKSHLTYNWWKYFLSAVLIAFGVSFLFTVTRYTVPEDKKIELYVYGYLAEDPMQQYMNTVREEEMPETEEMSCFVIMPDDQYVDMVLQVRLMTSEGDLYVFPKDQFFNISGNGFLKPLEQYPEVMSFLEEKGMNVSTGWRTAGESEESHLYGIPLSQLPTLQNYLYAEDGYLSIFVNNGNEENVVKFFLRFLRDMSEPLPEEMPAAEENAEAVQTESK